MPNELTEKIPEISYPLQEPDSEALYVMKTSWKLDARNVIDEDARYVMGPSYSRTGYMPIPFEVFQHSINELGRRGALQISPRNLFESIDYSSLDVPRNVVYVMDSSGVFMRTRRDNYGVHTMKMIGKEGPLVRLLSEIGLPNPLEPEKYPYKSIFVDESGANGKIMVLS